MAKQTYESIPTTCQAEQYLPNVGQVPEGVHPPREEADRPYVITTHGQRAYLDPGDFIVGEPDGNGHYPVKPAIFAKRWRLPVSTLPVSRWEDQHQEDGDVEKMRAEFRERLYATTAGVASPHNGGCWYCHKLDDELTFCCEFDTYVHPACAAEAAKNPDDREAQIINAEVNQNKLDAESRDVKRGQVPDDL